jgi:CHAT domain-containing protein/tetratricopeptide (TPR) repeat protein
VLPALVSLVVTPLAAATFALASFQSGPADDEITAAARRGDRATLVVLVRTHPDEAREALRDLLVMAAHSATPATEEEHLSAAELLGRAYAEAWTDSFLLRQVGEFRTWSASQRAVKLSADSLRLAGNDAYRVAGIDESRGLWRAAFERSASLPDSVGMARSLGNIVAAFYGAGALDSAVAYLERARDLAVTVGDHRTAANGLTVLADVMYERGNLAGASLLYRRSLEVRTRIGDAYGVAADEHNLGLVYRELGDSEAASRQFRRAREINLEHGYRAEAADNLLALSDVAVDGGEYSEAEALLQEVAVVYRELGDLLGQARTHHRSGLLEMRRGRYRQALPTLETAADLYQDAGRFRDVAAVRQHASAAHAAVGDLDGALHQLHAAERAAGQVGAQGALEAELSLARGDLAIRFNQPETAQQEFNRAEVLYREAGDDAGVIEARLGVGYLLVFREEYSRAAAAFDRVVRDQLAQGNAHAAAKTRLLVGYSRDRSGDLADARASLSSAAGELSELGDPVWEAAALSMLGDFEVRTGSPPVARSLYEEGLARLAKLDAPDVRWRLLAGLGDVLAQLGQYDGAAARYQAATTEIERVGSSAGLEGRRLAYLADKWEVYGRLAVVELERGEVTAAFEVSERMRARRMLAMLSAGHILTRESGVSDLAAREQDLRLYLANPSGITPGVTTRQAVARDPGSSSSTMVSIETVAAARATHSHLLDELWSIDEPYASLVAPKVVAAGAVAGLLADDEVLLEYLVSDSTTLVFVITADGLTSLDLGIERRSLTALVDFARGAIAGPRGDPGRDAWEVPLRRLHRELIGPVEDAGLLAGKRHLRIVPHGELHYLPFQALLGAGPSEGFLIERYVVSYAPSASVWVRLAALAEQHEGSRVLAMAPLVDRLPASRIEAETIRSVLGSEADVLIGPDASEQVLRASAGEYGVLHLATVGEVNKANPLYSFVQLHGGGSQDGRLEVHEVLGLSLDAELVVLSACETGLGSGALADVPSGDDWVGLVRAFLHAGASNVLGSLWRVEDLSTAQLMRAFYEQLGEGIGSAEALARAQRAMLGRPDTAHPFFWAGFVLSGSS